METNVSAEDRHKVYEICRTQLSGKWTQIDENDLIVGTVLGWDKNNIFICCLPENVESDYPKVVVRTTEVDSRVLKAIHILSMNVILSERSISPKLLSAFEGGTITEYIQSRYFDYEDELNEKSARLLARILAKFHSIQMPITKNPLYKTMFQMDSPFFSDVVNTYNEITKPEIERQNIDILIKLNFIDEMNWLLKVIDDLNSPVVFSHNDLGRKNILVKQPEQQENPEIILIDFDWSSYNYRGVDLGHYFADFGQFKATPGQSKCFPTDEQITVFIDAYIKEMCKIFGYTYVKQEINSMERLIKETKVFVLMSYLKYYVFCICRTKKDKAFVTNAVPKMKSYQELKNKLVQKYGFKI